MAGQPALREPGGQQGVTVVVRRDVRPDRRADYEGWLARLIESASVFPGYLGTDVHRPSGPAERRYTSVFRFDSVEHLQAFEDSDVRRAALREVSGLVEGDAQWERLTGLEVWFSAPPGTVAPQPSKARMALLLWVVVYGLVLSIGSAVAMVLSDIPMQVRLMITIAIEVVLMTYVLMPRLTRWLAKWIYPAS